MKLQMLFIGALMFGVLFVIGLNVYGQIISDYDVNVDTPDEWGRLHSNLKQYYDTQEDLKSNIRGGTVTDADAVDDMIKGGYTGIRASPFEAVGLAANQTTQLMVDTDYVDPLFAALFAIILSIVVVFAIVELVFRFNQ